MLTKIKCLLVPCMMLSLSSILAADFDQMLASSRQKRAEGLEIAESMKQKLDQCDRQLELYLDLLLEGKISQEECDKQFALIIEQKRAIVAETDKKLG